MLNSFGCNNPKQFHCQLDLSKHELRRRDETGIKQQRITLVQHLRRVDAVLQQASKFQTRPGSAPQVLDDNLCSYIKLVC